MFKCVTKKVVEFLGESDGLLPNENHYESEKLKLTALVEMKKKKYFFQSDKYYPKEILLHHVSEEQDLNKLKISHNEPLGSLAYFENLSGNGHVNVEASKVFQVNMSVNGNRSLAANLEQIHRSKVCKQSLINQFKSSKLDMSHPLLEQMCESDTNVLCVVTSVVETAATVLLSSQDSVDGKVNTKVTVVGDRVDVGGGGSKTTNKSATIPEGTVLAYEIVELQIDCNTGDTEMVLSNKAKGGFGIFQTTCQGPNKRRSFLHKKKIPVSKISAAGPGQGYDLVDDQTEICVFEEDNVCVTTCFDTDEKTEDDFIQDMVTAFQLSPTDAETVVESFIKACQHPNVLAQMALTLEEPDKNYAEMGCILKQHFAELDLSNSGDKAKEVLEALLMMATVLVEADKEVLKYLSYVTCDEISLLSAILTKTKDGKSLSSQDQLVTKFCMAPKSTQDLLLEGLNYQHDESDKCFKLPKNTRDIQPVFLAITIFNHMLNG